MVPPRVLAEMINADVIPIYSGGVESWTKEMMRIKGEENPIPANALLLVEQYQRTGLAMRSQQKQTHYAIAALLEVAVVVPYPIMADKKNTKPATIGHLTSLYFVA